jgi:hypothetical protein
MLLACESLIKYSRSIFIYGYVCMIQSLLDYTSIRSSKSIYFRHI